jgi:hypothetical protein
MSSMSQIYFQILNTERRRFKVLPFWRRLIHKNKSKSAIFLEALGRMSDLDIVKITEDALGYRLPQFQDTSVHMSLLKLSTSSDNHGLSSDGGPREEQIIPLASNNMTAAGCREAMQEESQQVHRKHPDSSALNGGVSSNPKRGAHYADLTVELQEVIVHSPDTRASIPQNRDSLRFSPADKSAFALQQSLRQPALNSSLAHASAAVSKSTASQPPSTRRPPDAATTPLDETENSSKSGFLSRSRVMTIWQEYVSQSSLDDEQASGHLHELMVLDTLPDEPPSHHVAETEAARSSGYQEGTISKTSSGDQKKTSVSVLPQHRPANKAVLGAVTGTAVGPSKRLGREPAGKPPLSERNRDAGDAEVLTNLSNTATSLHKEMSDVSDRSGISPMRSTVHAVLSSSASAPATSRDQPKESVRGASQGTENGRARGAGVEWQPSGGSSRLTKSEALLDTPLQSIVLETDARDAKQPLAPKSKSTPSLSPAAAVPPFPHPARAVGELSDAFGAPPPFHHEELKLANRRKEKATARDAQRRSLTSSTAASVSLIDVHPHHTASSAVDPFGSPPPFDDDDLRLAKRREEKAAARSAHGPIEKRKVNSAHDISQTPSPGSSMRHKPAASTPVPLISASTSSLPIEKGTAQMKLQRGASRASGAGETGAGGGIENRSERRKQGSNYVQA